MKALGMYPGNPIDVKWFGDDFAGVVTRVGEGVTDIAVGDSVVGMAPYCFRSYVTVNRHMVFKKGANTRVSKRRLRSPPSSSPPTTRSTNSPECARASGSLVHAGTGGVGMAAIQIAKGLGLEIFATAGTPQKRELLLERARRRPRARLPHAGVRRRDHAHHRTGKGVDCVLNSLAGDFIPKSFSVLRTFGRFVEIGKIDIYNNSKLGLEQLRNNISYFVVDLAQHLQDKPEYVAEMFADAGGEIRCRRTTEPLPHTTFPITEVVEAFRYMAQGKHVGQERAQLRRALDQSGALYRGRDTSSMADASYLITGGMSGFGFELAKWMARNGARNLVLMSRSGARDESDRRRDPGDGGFDRGDHRRRAWRRHQRGRTSAGSSTGSCGDLPPLRGVIHGAMVLDDQFMGDMDDALFHQGRATRRCSARGTLHRATRGDRARPLHLLLLVLGRDRCGEASELQRRQLLPRRARPLPAGAGGLPAMTINWGALIGRCRLSSSATRRPPPTSTSSA